MAPRQEESQVTKKSRGKGAAVPAKRSSRSVRATIDTNALFEQELSKRSISFVRQDEDTYRIQLDGSEVTASLANLRRNVARDKDPELVTHFVDKVLEAFSSERPDWKVASKLLLWAAAPSDQEFGAAVREAVTDEVSRVLTLTDADHSRIGWVTAEMCDEWGVTVDQAAAAAFRNQDRLLRGVKLEVNEVAGSRLGMIPLDSPYKGSVIFAKSFKRLVEAALGWPVLVVLPCRDFIYVISDSSPLVGRMGSVVLKEFRSSGYPITTEVLRVSDEGIRAIGSFSS